MFNSTKTNHFHSADVGLSSNSEPSFPSAILPPQFFERAAEVVARELIGKKIVSTIGGSKVAGIILETAAYTGKNDPDTHIYRGESSKQAFWSAGSLYVYSSMGHALTTVATPPYGEGACVLIRKIQLVEGGAGIVEGPGKVSKVLGITTAINGQNIFQGCGVEIERGANADDITVRAFARSKSKAPELMLLFRGM